ncbi:1,4-dihydroxy-2-naphthoate prenyltransferase [Streptoalloteichus tenebrarius]|uniref:1,4-dihydroxy-2-naphthoate octaprenyltransferase n=1 Tax=Streptoalloteichus tenebrarius (strain ATCC 17920 / DSM 40477 / JCM 4838 / CBS 697.72 / NBRC 16177 / NCIMB 11028 / NRRL B-12390 / A12253. 1 / ISP 5477) TaxID=1933 RepID=A0ABT1I4W7_STRSD|nr:1,4-dihydroxy-2-naphthoate polyprenyltransferase [Streptoalloteichus tenebrarius]MCP2262640.1 1,4-dihydroxy-2-naphthoate prenyltransferase [Streptoalloteichus tenebrarius]BFF02461.1 1,4-dihydroxy-2-naphthoate polyprenyltransferase [Streptoalloteichus tenebrarius]
MATVAQWIEGARVRTLPNAIAPVVVGVGVATGLGAFVWWKAALALLVSLALIIGVNYANDYSDGVRGTDDNRVGPLRLVGSKLASPRAVLTAAWSSFAVAALAGSALVVASGQWWLFGLGALCVAGAWFYTGGKRPYGYAGLGEVAVFVFFGLVAVLGTVYVLSGQVTGVAVGSAVAVGCFSCAVLVANNLRDIPTDKEVGKRTLAVLLGDRDTRALYTALVVIPFLLTVLIGLRQPLALTALVSVTLVVPALRRVLRGFTGRALIPVLRDTGLAMLVWAIATGVALAL